MDLMSYLQQKPGNPPPAPTHIPQYPQTENPQTENYQSDQNAGAIYGYGNIDPNLLMNPSGVPPLSPMGMPDSSSYLKDMLRIDDYLDYLYHQLRGDTLVEQSDNKKYWVSNPIKPGDVGGPIATEEGIRIILSKVTYFLSKFASHAALTVEQAHGYAYEAATEMLYFCVLEGENYRLIRHNWSQLVLMVDAIVYLNLTRTVNAWESKRIAGFLQSREFSGLGGGGEMGPDFMSRFPGTR